jgi:hypothetical protein
MLGKHSRTLTLAAFAALSVPALVAQTAPRQLGTVKAIDGQKLTLTTAANATVVVTVSADTTILQLPPGSKDLKAATPSALANVAVGDRVLVTGKNGDDPTALSAARVILMKSDDIAAQKSAQQADWQRNGVSGLVRGVEGPVFTVAVAAKTYKVSTDTNTIFRRYAADSVAFQDAVASSASQVRTGDQISVRGPKSDDGTTITAQEIVTGTFQNLSGAISAVDVNAQTITLKDLISKQTETVHVTPNSDLRKLPAQAAAAFAHRNEPAATPAAGAPPAGAGASRRAGMDLSRMLARLPQVTLADLKPGDAVMIVASEGRSAGSLTAVTMLAGVEQLLSAPGASTQPITLSPWTLGVPEGGGGSQ